MDGPRQLLIIIRNKQPLQVIAPRRRVEQVRRERRVEHEALDREPLCQQRRHEILHVVRGFFDVTRKQRREQRLPVSLVAVGIELRRARAVRRFALDRERRQIRQRIDRHAVCRAPEREEFLRLRRREKLLRRGGAVRLLLRLRRGAQAVSVDELLELQLQEQVVELGPKRAADVLRWVKRERRVRHDRCQPVAVARGVLAGLQLADGGGLGLDVGEKAVDLVDAAVALHERHGRLFAHAGDAGDVVGRVTHEGLEVDHVDRGEAVLLAERPGRHILCRGLAHAGGDELDLCVLRDELETVLVSRHDDAVPARRLAAAADGADEIVGLVAGEVVLGNVHGGEHLLQIRQLHGQLRLVAERRLAPIERHAQPLGLLLVEQTLQRREKAVYRVGIEPVARRERADAVKRTVDDAVAVQNHQLHGRFLRIP